MPNRATSLAYNQASLEIWFWNVSSGWEGRFSEEVLEKGQQIYRESQITSLQLTEQDLIVRCAFARKETCYVVIEWGEAGPQVRASIEDLVLGRAVAVAGLYRMEELIADEITTLAHAPEKKVTAAARRPKKSFATKPETPSQSPTRSLTLFLEGAGSGLRVTASWTNHDGTQAPALSAEKSRVSPEEREAIVRLTGHLCRAGFRYRSDKKDFLLTEPEQILGFFKSNLESFREAFGRVEMDAEAQLMAEGVQEVSVVAQVEAAGPADMTINCRIRVSGQWLELETFERFGRAGRGLQRVPGVGMVSLAPEQSQSLAQWRSATPCPRYMVFSLFGNRGVELNLKEAMQTWCDTLSSGPESAADEGDPLPDFLRDYQASGVRWMAHLRKHGCHGLLADEMGLGKTLQVLTLLQLHPFERKDHLIVCPASVIPVWESEARRWYPDMKTEVLRSGHDFNAPAGRSPRLWIASYTQLRRHKHLLEKVDFGYAVLDEAQQIKNPDTKATHACCAIRSEYRLALTGTPLENRWLDLWSIFRFLMPGLLGARARFEMAAGLDDARRAEFEHCLRKQLAPFILRRQKDTVGKDLPLKVEMDLVCPISHLQRQTYQQLLARGRQELGHDLKDAMQKQSVHVLTLLTRLRQACCDPGLIPEIESDLTQSGKIQTLLIHLQEALNGNGARKVVIFSQFVQLLKRLKPLIRESFPNSSLFELTGSTRDRRKPVQDFQEKEGPAVILVSLKAGGTGITLHAADYVFLLDPWWNPAVESQAVDRVHRIGQNRRVFVYRMITQGTIEERIQHLKREKRDLFEKTLGALEANGDLFDHFADLEELAKLLPNSGQSIAAR